MTLGEKIKEARKKAGLSQEQLAERLGVSRSAVAKWETDKGIPDVDNLKVLSKLLNVSVDCLLDDGEVIDKLVMRKPYKLEETTYDVSVVTKRHGTFHVHARKLFIARIMSCYLSAYFDSIVVERRKIHGSAKNRIISERTSSGKTDYTGTTCGADGGIQKNCFKMGNRIQSARFICAC